MIIIEKYTGKKEGWVIMVDGMYYYFDNLVDAYMRAIKENKEIMFRKTAEEFAKKHMNDEVIEIA
ncbi:MAG: hypothetical protein ACM34M_15415 [Ignavibacteria bacterium]